MKRSIALLLLTFSCSAFFESAADAEWKVKQAPIMTRFAADVKADAPLPEYPRPQLTRDDWLNLNGIWEYQPGKADDATPFGTKLSSEILVPFPVESALSGVMEHHDRLWYRRAFTVPAAWRGRQVMLHFGAVDYETEVFVNGKSAGTHKGGYDPFSFDVTPLLNGDGPQELIVKVFDPTNAGGQPRGKQSLRPGGIMYTPTSGIWQTVWLEPVAAGGVRDLKIVPDVDGGNVKVTVNTLTPGPVVIAVKDGDQVVARARGASGTELSLDIPNAKLWSPETPFLYDLTVSVAGPDDRPIDSVGSYFGMRKIERRADAQGVQRMMLNGKFVFQLGPLDQGFWPDGIYTAPTDAAIQNDIQIMKDLGFNMVRKHIKVEPARWYYWTDHLGLLVWQDMPSANSYDDQPTPPVDKAAYEHEMTRMIETLHNVPSIIMWVTFNEGQGQYDTARLVGMVKQMDPTRLVNQASGGGYDNAGDVYDIHSYPPPNVPRPNPTMALACGEYGGIGMSVPGHLWAGTNGGYMNVNSADDLLDTYAEFSTMLKTFRDERGLSAAVYTQITDVETELNGLLTYDRVLKMDVATIARANRFEIPPPLLTVVVPTSEKESQDWTYTVHPTQGDAWTKKDFKEDETWTSAKGGFGSPGTPSIGHLGTEWRSNDIWMRRTFTVGDLTPAQLETLPLRVYHDEDVQIYINGVLAYRKRGFNGHYENVPMTPEARKAIVLDGKNTLAVHCRQSIGGQYIDVGLVIRTPGTKR